MLISNNYTKTSPSHNFKAKFVDKTNGEFKKLLDAKVTKDNYPKIRAALDTFENDHKNEIVEITMGRDSVFFTHSKTEGHVGMSVHNFDFAYMLERMNTTESLWNNNWAMHVLNHSAFKKD